MQENDRSFNDDLYDYLCQKDEISFWKAWQKRFCSNSLKPTNVLNGKVGTDNVLSEFTSHFASIALPHTTGANDALWSSGEVEKYFTLWRNYETWHTCGVPLLDSFSIRT